MNKRLIAVLPLLCVLALAMGGTGTAPTVAAPTTPSLTDPATPAMDATPDEWGTCRWYCGSKSYATAAQCAANCSFQCEDIC